MTHRFDVFAPIHDFHWSGGEFSFAPNVALRKFLAPPDLRGLEKQVSAAEWERSLRSRHWLAFRSIEDVEPAPSTVINLFLVSLWLVKPIRSQVALKFEIGVEGADGTAKMSRLLDRFAWIPGATTSDIETGELELAATFYAKLEALAIAHGRLNNALVLTVSGCWSHGWQTALICQAAAVETILSYATGRGLTRRLAESYACLIEVDAEKRDAAFREFVELYSVRSDIIHGRMHRIAKRDALPTLLRFQNLVRQLWRAVLTDPNHMASLERDDAERRAHLRRVQQGYSAP